MNIEDLKLKSYLIIVNSKKLENSKILKFKNVKFGSGQFSKRNRT